MNRPLVLVVEDEPSVREFVKTVLERGGYAVEPVCTGAQALEMLGVTGNGMEQAPGPAVAAPPSFCCIVSDMRTPGGVDGAALWTWIERHRPEMLERLLFVSGDVVNEETAEVLRRTGAPYLEKPFRTRELLSAVDKVAAPAVRRQSDSIGAPESNRPGGSP
jgi:CheY-like chemotaxis protein